MESDKRDDMIRKIQALLSKAEDKGCTPEESEAFYAKAQDLMSKWAIDEVLLKAKGVVTNDKIITVRLSVASTYFSAIIALWAAAGRANDCVILQSKQGSRGQVVVIGYESDVVRVQMLVTSLQLFAQREAQRESSRQGGDYYFRRSFLTSFAHRIGARLLEQRNLNVQEASVGSSDLLPALLSKGKDVEMFVKSTMNVGASRGGRQNRHSYQGSAAGRAAADRADIGNKGVSGSRGALNH